MKVVLLAVTILLLVALVFAMPPRGIVREYALSHPSGGYMEVKSYSREMSPKEAESHLHGMMSSMGDPEENFRKFVKELDLPF